MQLITLKNDKIEVQLLTYAAIIHRIIVPDRKGNPTDVVLGYPSISRQHAALIRNEMSAKLGDAARLPQVANQLNATVAVMTSPAYRSIVRYNPEADMRRVAVPWFALNGSRDTQVLPANLATIRVYNPAAETLLVEDHNHLFQPCTTGLVDEYATIDGDISAEVLEAVAAWLDRISAKPNPQP